MTIRVAIADDHALFVAGLRSLLALHPDIDVVGEVRDGTSAVDLAERLEPHIMVLDVSMPGLNGIGAARAIAERAKSTRTICLSMHREKRLITAALRAGASGYLAKDCESGDLVRAIRAVAAGHMFLSPDVTAELVADLRRDDPMPAHESHGLTTRETEVLTLIADGHSTKAIAGMLRVSVKTVGTHRENVMRKLGVRSVAGLTKFAVRAGLTTLEAGADS